MGFIRLILCAFIALTLTLGAPSLPGWPLPTGHAQALAEKGEGASGGEVLEINADSIEYDGKAKVTRASGRVNLRYGDFRATCGTLEFEEDSMRALLRKDVRLEGPGAEQGKRFVIGAPEVEFFTKEEKAFARGGVGATYNGMSLASEKLEAYFREGRVLASGDVRMEYRERDLVARGGVLTYFENEKKIELIENAQVESRGRVFAGGKIVAFLEENRLIGSGGTKLFIPATSKGGAK